MPLPLATLKSAVQKVTGTGIGDRTRLFFHGIAWTFSGAVIARVLSGLSTLYVARCLGPSAFGEASLALAASLWIQVPLLWGLPTALIHYLPTVGVEERSQWSTVGLTLLGFSVLSTLAGAALLKPYLSQWLGITPRIMSWTLFWCAGFAVYTASVSWLSAEEKFSIRARMEVAFATLFMVSVVTFRLTSTISAGHYIKAYCFAYLGVGAWVFYTERNQFAALGRFRDIARIGRKLFGYGLVVALGGVASALLLAPARLIANRCLTPSEVGLLAVYQGGAIQMALFAYTVIVQVLFPIASRTPDKTMLRKKMNRVIVITAVPCFVGLIGLLTLYFKVLGKHYPYDWSNAVVYSFSAYLSFVYGILAWFYAAIGKRGVLAQCGAGLVSGAINWVACWLLIPRMHVMGAGWAYAAGTFAGIVLLYLPPVQRWSGAAV